MTLLKKIFFVIISLLAINCPSHQEVDAFAKLYLTVKNNSNETVVLKYIKPKTFEFGDSVYITGRDSIKIKSDSIVIKSFEQITDTLEYKFKRSIEYPYNKVDGCYIEESTSKNLRVDVMIYKADSLCVEKYVFPWDTSEGTGEYIENCYKESWDTITVK